MHTTRRTLISGLPAVFAFCLLPSAARASGEDCPPGLTCLEPWQTVELEHADRMQRLRRLGGGRVRVFFATETINPSEHGLKSLPVAIPILRVVFDQSVFFDTGSDVVRPEARDVLAVVAESLKREPPDVALFIAGHTDDQGSNSYNLQLGLRRAEAVAGGLIRRGIYQASVYRISFGEAVPIADNRLVAGRARNRRVEFLFGAHPRAVISWLEKQAVTPCSRDGEDVRECETEIVFEAAKVEVDPSRLEDILEIEKREEAIEMMRNMPQQEIDRQKSIIELERSKIPVSIARDKELVIIKRK